MTANPDTSWTSPELADLLQRGSVTFEDLLRVFGEITGEDYEFTPRSGERPDVVCVGWHQASTAQTRSLPSTQLGADLPFSNKALFLNFVGNAECACRLTRGWPLPEFMIDLSAEFRRVVNGRDVKSKGLIGALDYFGLDSIGAKKKEGLQELAIRGGPYTGEEWALLLAYVGHDAERLIPLLRKMLPAIGNIGRALLRGASVAALARMEHRGVPIDAETFPLLTDRQAWSYVRDAVVPTIDAAYGVYVQDGGGDWHFDMKKFEAFLDREGIVWPRTPTGKLSTSEKNFEAMTKAFPQLEDLRQLRHMRNKMRRVQLAVGATDSRCRTVLWPFKAKTSRIQPKAKFWIFSPAVWLRHLIKPAPGFAFAYVDWSSMEFMVAAGLSGDPVMIKFYVDGDPYLTFAKHVSAVPSTATKLTHGDVRDRYKVAMLAPQYGIKPLSLASRLGVSVYEASEMLAQHRETFSAYWAWAADWTAHAFDSGWSWTPYDWQCRTGITEFNERSIGNFPVQATAADALRITLVWAARHHLPICAPVHDAIALESPIERVDADVKLLRELMRRSSKLVLNSTADGVLELRTDETIIRHPGRFTDKRGVAMWDHVMGLLAEHRKAKAS